MIRGKSVMWAPDRIDRPTASASSWIDGLGDLFRRLVQAGVDHLEAGFPKGPGDHPGTAVVAVEAGFRHHHPIDTLHHSDTRRSDGRRGQPARAAAVAWAAETVRPV